MDFIEFVEMVITLGEDIEISKEQLLEFLTVEGERRVQNLDREREEYIKSVIADSVANFNQSKLDYNFSKVNHKISGMIYQRNSLIYAIDVVKKKLKYVGNL